ncbi:hypothetical protein ENSA7_40160 [Enhygromyxa salina]|uniref:SGNH hydrolase-type esterase domain-containing protein n=1 Tax=Enhygromyxa salina TaxID=215803 RepID=A0A2S9YMM2_9BACT|nr:hypothetical protein ENSA7_40160 [Enhygromyxa salina]
MVGPAVPPTEPVLAAVSTQVAPAPVVEQAPPPLFVELGAGPMSTSCRAVAHIGDSTSTGMMKEYHVPNPADRLDAQYARVGVEESVLELAGGRSMLEHRAKHENGVMVAERLRDAGFSGCWVIALGTNDAANVAKDATVDRVDRIERMMAVIDGEPVLWVDAVTKAEQGYWAAPNMEVWNDELATTLSRHPNARIYQWSHDIQDDWYVKDGIHYNSKGTRARAKLIPDALAAAFPAV